MVKTKIVETTEKFDKEGKLVERITREETSEDDETRYPVTAPYSQPYSPNTSDKRWDPYCTVNP